MTSDQLQRELGALIADRDRLLSALQYCRDQAEQMRTWNGHGFAYHPIYAEHIHDAARIAIGDRPK